MAQQSINQRYGSRAIELIYIHERGLLRAHILIWTSGKTLCKGQRKVSGTITPVSILYSMSSPAVVVVESPSESLLNGIISDHEDGMAPYPCSQ